MSDTSALRQVIADQLERQPSDIIGSPSLSVGLVINREINAAIAHYESSRMRWNQVRESEFATTVSGTRAYSLPATLVKLDTLKVIYSDAWIPLQKRSWSEIEERHRQVTGAQGLPFEYTTYANVLRLYPVPNQALTLVGSYVQRFPPTSLTGSYCAVITMGGGSLTVTSTASHNNRLNGWTTDGEEVIRHRAFAAVKINYLRDAEAKLEAGALAQMREGYLSMMEKQAFERLADEAADFGSAGYVRPYEI